MSNVGEKLKEERQKQELSLQDIERITSIRQRYLQAVENGDYSVLPGEVYTKGFIRNYAIALGLNGDDFVSSYKLETEIHELKEKSEGNAKQKSEFNLQPVSSSKNKPEMFNNEKVDKKTNSIQLIFVCCFIVIISLSAYIAFDFTKTPEQTTNQVTTVITQAEPLKTPSTVANDDKKQNDVKIINDRKGSIVIVSDSSSKVENIAIDVEFNESCWTRVVADGKEVYSGILSKGNKSNWQAKENIYIKFGNVFSAKMKVNGQQIDTISDAGPVAETSITIAK